MKVARVNYKKRIIYPVLGKMRNNNSFRNQTNPEYLVLQDDTIVSPLLQIEPHIDIILQFY